MTQKLSDDDFIRASKLMEDRFRNLESVRDNVNRRFKTMSAFYDFRLLPQGESDFRAYVFFKHDTDIRASQDSGVDQEIIDFVYAELERQGRGKRGDIAVAFEFDSN